MQALIAKRVDGAPLNSSFAARVLQYDYLHVVGDAAKDLPDFLYTWEVVAAEAAERKRAALKAFVIATAKGCRWAMANPDAAAAINKKILPDLPPAELEAAARDFAKKRFFSTDRKAAAGDLGFHGRDAREAWEHQAADPIRGRGARRHRRCGDSRGRAG